MKWRRPYRWSWFQVFAGLLLLGGSIGAISVMVTGALRITTHPGKAAADLIVGAVWGVGWVGLLGRVALMGIYVGKKGLRYRAFLHTTTVPWDAVAGVKLVPLNFGGIIAAVPAMAIYIQCVGRPSIRTWVNNKGADFLGRPKAFDRAFHAIHEEVELRRRVAAPD